MITSLVNWFKKQSTDKPLVNVYSAMYALCLWASVFFIEHGHKVTFHVNNSDYTIGLIFLAWVSTFRDLAQASGLRFRSILVLLVMCAYLLFDVHGHVGYAAVAALFWTEILDFAIFTGIWRTLRNLPLAVVLSDIVTVPALWFLLFTSLGLPLERLPDGTITVQFVALGILYVVLGLTFLPNGRWRAEFGAQKESGEPDV